MRFVSIVSTLLLGTAWIAFPPRAHAQSEWPQFRGAVSNPTAENERLPDRWSTTENVEWSSEVPGRGWSSPIVTEGRIFLTTVVTDGESKPPQVGTDYSNEYMAELTKQGLKVSDAVSDNGLVMEHHRSVAADDFDAFTTELSAYFDERGWDYDGWECAVTTGLNGKG